MPRTISLAGKVGKLFDGQSMNVRGHPAYQFQRCLVFVPVKAKSRHGGFNHPDRLRFIVLYEADELGSRMSEIRPLQNLQRFGFPHQAITVARVPPASRSAGPGAAGCTLDRRVQRANRYPGSENQ